MPSRPRQPRPKSKHWVFTINNPTEEDAPDLTKISYIISGREVGEEGTEHMQGYVCFNNRLPLTAVKKLMPRAHLEIKRGTVKEAIDYCKKDGDWKEWGTRPKTKEEGTTERWTNAIIAAKEGNYDDIPPDMLVRYYHSFKRIHQDNPVKPDDLDEKANEWIVVPSGYGKSTYARKKYPDYFDKAPNKWFIGYKGEGTLLLDDFSPKQCEHLDWLIKRWADVFSFPAETKGGGYQIRPEHIVITSQYEIYQCFEDPLVVEAIQNRFHVTQLTRWQDRETQADE